MRISTARPKIFKCPVHGYVSIPRVLVDNLIDTEIFQRLRFIEQTSMRPLYPSAHHNRFVHSLGVYELSSLAFHHICKNTPEKIVKPQVLEKYRWTFCIAALMHDCGHAPFSHTFEHFYQVECRAQNLLFSEISSYDRNFQADFNDRECRGLGPSAHEIFSAAIFLKYYRKICSKFTPKVYPTLVARMITGVVHRNPNTPKKQIENCLIKLINGPIDVDKIDYVMRDTWASGVCNVPIDTIRLLSALLLCKYDGHIIPAFNKSALSVIQNVIEGRNFLYQWIYTHHTVCYFDHLLKNTINRVFKLLSPKSNPDRLIKVIFSHEVFEKPISCCTRRLYLPTDGDITALMKCCKKNTPGINELLSRKPNLVPLWKTRAEFESIFEKKTTATLREDIVDRIPQLLKTVIPKKYVKHILTLPIQCKLVDIREAEIYVSLSGNVCKFVDVVPTAVSNNEALSSFYYIFIHRDCIKYREKCISAIKLAPSYMY
jgi:uncharacterized protein